MNIGNNLCYIIIAPQALFVWWAADRSRFKLVFRYIDKSPWDFEAPVDPSALSFGTQDCLGLTSTTWDKIKKNGSFACSLGIPSKIPIP